jgi:NAD(P)-dependent dehydrogenase (short-subunit alcohol dehydrogenase family)
MRLAGKLAVITGAAAGIGREAALLFAREGAHVAAIDIDGAGLSRLAGEVSGIDTFTADLSKGAAARSVTAAALQALGGVDILWSHAGAFPAPPGDRADGEDLDEAMALNVRPSYVAARLVHPAMVRRGGGSIILTSSTSGIVGSQTNEVYAATKFALVGMAKSLALRWAADNVRVNAICPGPIDTPMQGKFLDAPTPEATAANYARVAAAVPLGRIGKALDVAQAGLWLASDEAGFVTGIALPVDGGFTAR